MGLTLSAHLPLRFIHTVAVSVGYDERFKRIGWLQNCGSVDVGSPEIHPLVKTDYPNTAVNA